MRLNSALKMLEPEEGYEVVVHTLDGKTYMGPWTYNEERGYVTVETNGFLIEGSRLAIEPSFDNENKQAVKGGKFINEPKWVIIPISAIAAIEIPRKVKA